MKLHEEIRNTRREGGLYVCNMCLVKENGKLYSAYTAYLNETSYKERVLLIKLKKLLDEDTLNEVKNVLQLKWESGYDDALGDGDGF